MNLDVGDGHWGGRMTAYCKESVRGIGILHRGERKGGELGQCGPRVRMVKRENEDGATGVFGHVSLRRKDRKEAGSSKEGL